MAEKFRGIMVPVTTPYDMDGNVLWDEFEKHIEIIITAGANSILVPSGTGEFANLTKEKRIDLTRHAAKVIDGRLPLVAMISDCSTENVLEYAHGSKAVGATELMLTPPYFSHLNQRAIKQFFTEVADNCELPLWIYHQPGETKLNVDIDTVEELSKHPNIIGIKVAPGEDFLYFTQLIRRLAGRNDFSVLNGEDFDLFASLALGGDGGVSSLANIVPTQIVGMFRAAERDDWAAARACHEKVMDAFDCAVDVSTGNYQSALKTVLMLQGIYSTNNMSSPFVTILPEEQKRVAEMAKAAGIA